MVRAQVRRREGRDGRDRAPVRGRGRRSSRPGGGACRALRRRDGGDGPVRFEMTRDRSVAGAEGGYAYRAQVPASRPAADYAIRIIPHHDGVAVPLETARHPVAAVTPTALRSHRQRTDDLSGRTNAPSPVHARNPAVASSSKSVSHSSCSRPHNRRARAGRQFQTRHLPVLGTDPAQEALHRLVELSQHTDSLTRPGRRWPTISRSPW